MFLKLHTSIHFVYSLEGSITYSVILFRGYIFKICRNTKPNYLHLPQFARSEALVSVQHFSMLVLWMQTPLMKTNENNVKYNIHLYHAYKTAIRKTTTKSLPPLPPCAFFCQRLYCSPIVFPGATQIHAVEID